MDRMILLGYWNKEVKDLFNENEFGYNLMNKMN